MKKRMAVMLAGMAVFMGAIGLIKFMQVRAAIAEGSSFQPPPEAVTTAVAQKAAWPATLSAIGTAEAVHGVTVSADLPGVVERIEFDSGKPVSRGDVLIRLDARQEEAQLVAALAQRHLTDLNFKRMADLAARGVTSQSEFDRAEAEFKQADARAGEIRAIIERKTIRAPFTGILGIRQVNLGQYLNGGDPVVPLQSLDPIYVNFGVPQQEVGSLSAGAPVEVSVEGMSGEGLRGRISAVNSVVDEATRNVQVQATFDNPRGILRPGMFVEVRVHLGAAASVVVVPASSIAYAPYGDSVFIVEDMKGPDGRGYRGVRQQFVKLGEARGDQIALASGVDPGQEVVTSGAFKLRNGAAVEVNNEVRPSSSLSPQPEDS